MKKLLSFGIQVLAAMCVGSLSGGAQAQTLPPGASARTEILTYDNWTVTCREVWEPREKRSCTAELSIIQDANKTRRVLLAWTIAPNKDGVLTSTLRFLPGVQIAPGVELKFSDKARRKFSITTCEPAYCEAKISLDEAFVRDASAVTQAEAIIQSSDGRQANITINMTGFARSLAMVRSAAR